MVKTQIVLWPRVYAVAYSARETIVDTANLTCRFQTSGSGMAGACCVDVRADAVMRNRMVVNRVCMGVRFADGQGT